MTKWVYFSNVSIAVREEHYKRHRDRYEGHEVAYVLDTETGERSGFEAQGAEKTSAEEPAPENLAAVAPKGDEASDDKASDDDDEKPKSRGRSRRGEAE